MSDFEPTENISQTDDILRVLAGAALLLATPTAITMGAHSGILPLIAVYLIITSIVKWDPIGYVLEIALRICKPAFTANITAHKV